MRVATTVLMGLLTTPAFASPCEGPYTLETLAADMTVVESGLREGETERAGRAGLRMRDGLGCLDEVLPAMVASRAYRAVGTGLWLAKDEAGATKWLRTALELDPTWVYGVDAMDEAHPFLLAFDALKDEDAPSPVSVEGMDFPAEATQYLNGRKLRAPKARLGRFHVFQAERDGLQTRVIEGHDFPPETLVEAAPPVAVDTKKAQKAARKARGRDAKNQATEDARATQSKARRRKKPKPPKTRTGPNGDIIYIPRRPPEKTPLMVIGAVVMAGAAGIYYGSSRSAAKFKRINTAADVNQDLDLGRPFKLCQQGQEPDVEGCAVNPNLEVTRLQGVTNRLVGVSTGVFLAGLGTFTWGAVVDGDSMIPMVNLRW